MGLPCKHGHLARSCPYCDEVRNARLAMAREIREMVNDRVEEWRRQGGCADQITEAGIIRTKIDAMIAKEEGKR